MDPPLLLRRLPANADVADAREAGTYPYYPVVSGTPDVGEVSMNGRRLSMLGSNNYRNLSHRPAVKEAVRQAVEEFGTATSGSRMLNGNLRIHEELESELAEFLGFESALVFPTGYMANLGAISGIALRGTQIHLDAASHASLIDGARLARTTGARMRFFEHNAPHVLAARLAAGGDEPALVVTEGCSPWRATSPRFPSSSTCVTSSARRCWWTTRTASACWAGAEVRCCPTRRPSTTCGTWPDP